MFHNLKMRLILINICSLSVVLIIIFSGIYIVMNRVNESQCRIFMRDVAKEEKIIPTIMTPNLNNNDPDFSNKRPDIFYIKINNSALILNISSNVTISKKYASSIVALALKSNIESGNINYNKLSLEYLKVKKQYGYIIVFLYKGQGDAILKSLLFTFLIIGTISIGLMLLISLFLANRALVPIKIVWDKQKNFIADASHELKTPLTVIKTNLEIIIDNKDETVEAQSKWIRECSMGNK